MMRRRTPWWRSSACRSATKQNDSLALALFELRRHLKTLDVREYRPLGTPIEFRFYQRYTNHPNRQSGIQFLTHYNTHQRFRVKKDYIDYMNWGKEQGQARLPHRHQRVAFDFHDDLHPTLVDSETTEWFREQDPTMGRHPDLTTSFDPNKKVFSHPEHWNKMFSKRRPGEGDIKLHALDSKSLLGPLVTQTDTQEVSYFHMNTQGPTHGKVPGINAPFLGEFDRKMMQAMSYPLNKYNTLTANDGRFSKTIFINEPRRHQCLSTKLAKHLNLVIDQTTNAVYSKLTVLTAAQSGLTDFFCGGLDLEEVGFDVNMAVLLRRRAESLKSQGDSKNAAERERLLQDANRHQDRADEALREHAALIWRAYTAPRPFMTLVNGKCRGTGCGLALAAKFCALRDATEFIFDGPHIGLTPYGGITHLLARQETSLKFPGLAEFVLLTGTSLFAGDVLRLGWTDLFTSLPDMTFHIKEWFDNSEHLHNDAVAWQLGHLLESCFKMKDAHSSAMERSAISPTRARWIEDAFADQPSVEGILTSLGGIEKLELGSPHNTMDGCFTTPYTLASVADGVKKLESSQLRYTLSPWTITPPEEEAAARQAGDIFLSYVLESRGSREVVVHRDREKLQRWKRQREEEYLRYRELQSSCYLRHVYARLEGCENTLVSFDFDFDFQANAGKAADADELRAITLNQLKQAVLNALKMPSTRAIELGWYLPTLDTAHVRSDAELQVVLHNDTGLEDIAENLQYPPVYFIVKRVNLYFSEWAYAVKHQMLLQSPFALKASFELLKEVRRDATTSQQPCLLEEALGMEYKYFVRCMQRPDFFDVGQHTLKSAEAWGAIKEARERQIHQSHLPMRPLPDFEAVFEREVELDGHFFRLRPRWSPPTLQEVSKDAIERLREPLHFAHDGVVSLCARTHCGKSKFLDGMIEDAGGLELVHELGELDKEGTPKVAPLKGNAHVPNNVNFYEMARHPWEDTPSSWRRNGFTEGSKEYFEAQYKEAERAVYDEEGSGAYSYWPSKDAIESTHSEVEERGARLLEKRLYGELERAKRGVEPWASKLREKALEGKLQYRVEIATQEEKIYDDEYYRWFITPGHHPNPSGLTLGRKKTSAKSNEDRELEQFLSTLIAGGTPNEALGNSNPDDAEDVESEFLDSDTLDPVREKPNEELVDPTNELP
ncbi:unnamed protein product [Phytomonas sp. EM1]|nr:unnamed protein product [Phytomonas sp. EM1]|eukprot:CCW65651.1 unnamed protein product [Phytomonas sp. isolate EM1]